VHIRAGTPRDVPIVLGFFDEAVAWLVSRGVTGQWGTRPFSASPDRLAAARAWADGGGMRIAEVDGEPAGAIVLGPPPPYAPAVVEPDLYVVALVTGRRFAGLGVGAALLARGYDEAAAAGVALLRVDCWDGGDGALVRYYERQGFTPTRRFRVREWQGQVLERRVRASTTDGQGS
jgi:GNAT superfamily N-acetyltransferase